MRKSKRIISLLTALCLTLGLCPASAAEGRTVSVGTARELIALSESCTLDTWSQGLTVELTADIDLGNAAFRPIPIFCGVFEGNGHRISGLRVTGKGSDQGLFRYLKEGAVVRNLELEGEILPEGTKSGLGLLCGRNEGTVTGVTVSGTVSGEEDVGGLVGVNEATGVLRQCENQAQITGVTHTGGIAGRNEGTIEACINRGAIDPDANDDAQDTGGIAGRSSGTITGSVNHGEIGYPHTGYNVGGIAGRQNGSVVGCENYGSIWGRKDVGGIVGQFEPYTVLTYGEDPMQRLDDELSRLSGLMTRLTDQISGYSGDAVDDLKAVSGAMDAIRETAHTAGTDGREDAQAAGEAIYDSAQIINGALGTLLDHTETFAAAADRDLTELGDAMDALRDCLDKGFTAMDSAAYEARLTLDAQVRDMEVQAGRISAAIEEIGAYFDALDGVVRAAGSLLNGGTLEALEDAVEELKRHDVERALTSIGTSLREISGDVTALRENLGDALDDFGDAADDTWEEADAALDRVSGAADGLQSACKGFSDAAIGELRTVNSAVDAIEDMLRQWLGALSGKGGNAADQIDEQLQLIGDRVDRLTDGAASANRDLHDTTGDILSQLDSVRSAITDLGSTPEKTVDDVSDSVEQEGEQGRVISCANHGEVTGDANVGGVAGILATELGLDPEEDLDIQNDKLLSDTTAYIKATVRDCRNAGAVTAKNDCAGGIIGRGEVGAVLDCRNTGDVETTSGGQCGGVAGLSRTVIRRSYALCSLTGNDKVGGVAGEGHDIRECYTMVSVVGGGERFGAVAGMADGEVERNYFVRESLAGIDGVDYAGKAEPMDYEDFAAVPGMPEEFLGFRITFLVDGAAIKTLAVPYGGDLDPESIPEVPRREGVYGAWEDFSQENIIRSRTVEAVYSDWITTISTGEEQPVLLLEGAFAPGARLEAEDWTPGAGKLLEGYRLAAGYTFSVEDRGQAELQGGYTVRVRVPDAKGEVCVAVWQDGALRLAEARREGSYLSFPMEREGSFAVLTRPGVPSPWLFAASAAVLAALLVLLRHKKRTAARRQYSIKKGLRIPGDGRRERRPFTAGKGLQITAEYTILKRSVRD